MINILSQYIENEMNVTEYTKDGKTVSHIVKTPIQQETEGDVLELPKNPLIQLQEKVVEQDQEIADLWYQIIVGGAN